MYFATRATLNRAHANRTLFMKDKDGVWRTTWNTSEIFEIKSWNIRDLIEQLQEVEKQYPSAKLQLGNCYCDDCVEYCDTHDFSITTEHSREATEEELEEIKIVLDKERERAKEARELKKKHDEKMKIKAEKDKEKEVERFIRTHPELEVKPK